MDLASINLNKIARTIGQKKMCPRCGCINIKTNRPKGYRNFCRKCGMRF